LTVHFNEAHPSSDSRIRGWVCAADTTLLPEGTLSVVSSHGVNSLFEHSSSFARGTSATTVPNSTAPDHKVVATSKFGAVVTSWITTGC
jgi:hypothetical protein